MAVAYAMKTVKYLFSMMRPAKIPNLLHNRLFIHDIITHTAKDVSVTGMVILMSGSTTEFIAKNLTGPVFV